MRAYRTYAQQARLVAALLDAAQEAERALPDGAVRSDLSAALDAFESASAFAVATKEDLAYFAERAVAPGEGVLPEELGEALLLAQEPALKEARLALWRVVQARSAGRRCIFEVGGRSVIAVERVSGGDRVAVTAVGEGGFSQEVFPTWVAAHEHAVDLRARLSLERAKRFGSKGDLARVAIPRRHPANASLVPGTAVVWAAGELTYEGNLYGAENLRTFSERAKVAAGRLFKRAPTVARLALSPGEFAERFRVVGQIDDAYALRLWAPAVLLDYLAPPGTSFSARGGALHRQSDGKWIDDQGDEVCSSEPRFIEGELLTALAPLV